MISELTKKATVVILVPAFKRESYEKEFCSERIIVVAAPVITPRALDVFFRFFYYYFVDTMTVKIIQQGDLLLQGRRVRYYVARVLTKIFGNSKALRQAIRFLDSMLVKDTIFNDIFDQYKPDVVYIPSITSDDEGLVLRQAKSRHIHTIGMVRSWDNITVNKGNIRVYPETLLTHSLFLKEDVVTYADMEKEKIEVVGMSHFDYYVSQSRIPREVFFKTYHGDISKKTIYFMPTGLSSPELDEKVFITLVKAIQTDSRFSDVQIMLSSHPNTNKSLLYAENKAMIVTIPGITYPGGKLTDKEITKEAMELMASSIYHSDVVINYQSTSSIDAAAFDKPIINIAWNEDGSKSYLKNIFVQYNFDHYQSILQSGGVAISHRKKDLLDLIYEYLNNPEKDKEARKQFLLEQNGGFTDGLASKRTADALLAFL